MTRTFVRGVAPASCFALAACFALVACDDRDSDKTGTFGATDTDGDTDAASSGDTDGATDGDTAAELDPIDIAGSYVETFDGGMVDHEITDTTWTSDSGDFTGVLQYTLVDNDAQFVVGEDPDNAGVFSKYQWSMAQDGSLYYCTVVFDATSTQAAADAPPADASDPANGGCAGFSWSLLDPV